MKNVVAIGILTCSILMFSSGILSAGSLPQFGVVQKPFEPLKKSKAQSLAFVDDFLSTPKVNLSFPFLIGGKWYTEVNIHENGFIWFGTEKLNGENVVEPLQASSISGVEAVIAALGTDLQSGVSSKAHILTQVSGAAPERIFTVEWTSFARAEALLEGAKENLSFQIRLFEKNGQVEIHYGALHLSAMARSSAQVGISINPTNPYAVQGAVSQSWLDGIRLNTPVNKLPVDAQSKPLNGLCYRIYPEMPYIVAKNEDGFKEKVVVEDLPSAYYKSIYTPQKGVNISQRYLAIHRISDAKDGLQRANERLQSDQNRIGQMITSIRWRNK